MIEKDIENRETKQDEEEAKTKTPEEEQKVSPKEEQPSENGSDIQAQLDNILGSQVNLSGGDILQTTIHKIGNIINIFKSEVKEQNSVRDIPPPAPLDALSQEKINEWFANKQTTDRDKFFAITLSIFDGLKYPDFRSVYEIILHVMNVTETEEEKNSRSLFDIADEDLIESLNVEIVRTDDGLEEIIRFKKEGYATAIFDLMRRRYRRIFLDLLFALKQVVEKHHYWEIRYRAAVAVAEIGKLGFYQMRSQVLEPWARDKRGYVRAAVGYPLAQLVRDKQYQAGVKELLNDWIKNDSDDATHCRWTAASAYKQIGLIGTDWAKEWAYLGLKEIASFDDTSAPVIHSLVVLSLQGQLESVLYALKGWMEQEDDDNEDVDTARNRHIVAVLTLWLLSEIYIEVADDQEETSEIGTENNLFSLIQQSQANDGMVWRLAVSLGVRAFEHNQNNSFFALIARWSSYAAKNGSWRDTLSDLLVGIFVKTDVPLDREYIWNTLKLWANQKDEKSLAHLGNLTRVKIKRRVL